MVFMSKIIDTNEGLRFGVHREPDNNEFLDMVTLHWTRNTGETFETVYPRRTAIEFLNKHLIPQRDQGLLSDVGITELESLGTF